MRTLESTGQMIQRFIDLLLNDANPDFRLLTPTPINARNSSFSVRPK